MERTADEKSRLIDLLHKLSPDSSKTNLRSWVKEGRVKIDGKLARHPNQDVEEGSRVEVGKRIKFLDFGIRVLYEDEHLIVIEKPEGLLSVPLDEGRAISAHEILKNQPHNPNVHSVHRLDRDTSGILVYAYSFAAREGLKELFADHAIEREYFAVVEGEFKSLKGTWNSHLVEDQSCRVHVTHDKRRGKEAITHYRLRKVNSSFSLLQVGLETGRKNQIRVHCSDAGHPIVGDKKYGAKRNPIKRVGLHASHLAFAHPVTGKAMRFDSEVPPAFLSLFE